MRQRASGAQTGFTLLELMIVLVLMGVLAGLVIPSAFQAREKAYMATMKHDLKKVATAQELFFVDNQRYAGHLADLMDGLKLSEDVTVRIDSVSSAGWRGDAEHVSTSVSCFISYSSDHKGLPTCVTEGGEIIEAGSGS